MYILHMYIFYGMNISLKYFPRKLQNLKNVALELNIGGNLRFFSQRPWAKLLVWRNANANVSLYAWYPEIIKIAQVLTSHVSLGCEQSLNCLCWSAWQMSRCRADQSSRSSSDAALGQNRRSTSLKSEIKHFDGLSTGFSFILILFHTFFFQRIQFSNNGQKVWNSWVGYWSVHCNQRNIHIQTENICTFGSPVISNNLLWSHNKRKVYANIQAVREEQSCSKLSVHSNPDS